MLYYNIDKVQHIVAIGASAGGLVPILNFFDATPVDSAAYIIIRHISTNYKSALKSILDKHSVPGIVEARNGMLIKKNKVYLIPTAMYMTIEKGKLYLTARDAEFLYPNWSIDVFFESLALDKGKDGIAVILSGAGSDGAKGIVSIKESGGMVIAQDPASCEHSSMPKRAISTGLVDHVLFPSKMPPVIRNYIEHNKKNFTVS